MAEEAPKVQNKGLLAVAIVLAAVVVVIYNLHINEIRNENKGKQVLLLKMARTMQAGEKIDIKDLKSEPVRAEEKDSLGSVITDDRKPFVAGRVLAHGVEQGQWLQYNSLIGGVETVGPQPSPGNIGLTLELDQRASPGVLLNPNDRVNILGMISVDGKPPRAYRIIQGLRVMVTGTNVADSAGSGDRPGARSVVRSYRTIAVDISPAVSLQLMNILSHVQGTLVVEVLPIDARTGDSDGKINPAEPDLATLAKAGRSKEATGVPRVGGAGAGGAGASNLGAGPAGSGE